MTSIIEIKGNKCKILNENDFLFIEGLDMELSFRIQGAEFSKAYKSGRWSGIKHILTSNLIFPLGLLQRVLDFYKQSNKEVKVIDRNSYLDLQPIDILPRLKELNKEPRYYQLSACEEAIKQKKCIVKICTGGGKTLLAALVIAKIGRKAIFFTIGKELLYQTHKLFEDIFQQKIGFIGDGICEIQDITVASIWSVCRALNKSNEAITIDDDETFSKEKEISEVYNDEIKQMVHSSYVNILDECHICSTNTMQTIGSEFTGEYSLGLSATPTREDGQNLLIESIFGKIAVSVPATELIDKGYLVKPTIKFIPVPRPKAMLSNYREIYKADIVCNDERNDLIIRAGISLVDQDFVTLVLYKEINHGKYLYEKFKEKGQHCYLLSGTHSTEFRQSVIKEVTDGDVKLILASSIFDIGLDLCNLSALVLSGGGKSGIRALQRIGRILRPYPGKDMAVVIDFADKSKYLKNHYLIRKRIYQSEPGFEIID